MVQLNDSPPPPGPVYDIDEILDGDDGPRDEDDGPWPLYDIEAILATLTLEEERESQALPAYSPLRALAHLPRTPTSAPPRTPTPPPRTPTPPPRTPTPPPPQSSPTLYMFHSPHKSGFSADWSEAGASTQGQPQSYVCAVRKARSHGPKAKAYTIFRGTATGVFDSWREVEAATSGVRFALYKGYTTRPQAEAAYELAVANGWTCSMATWTSTPISAAQAPRPPVLDQSTRTSESALGGRGVNNPWYVVYAGVNPGLFPTFVECALNVLGIEESLHEKLSSYAEARQKFERAQQQGEVHVRRLCPDALNARRTARREAARKYREKNRSRLAEEAREARARAKADKAREARHEARVARVTARLQANSFYHNLIIR
ncbi:hypothetical protein B0H14DRAFT_3494015 [Mycena olivaceomarginata]|nr:hypothetical protein B0H14DRAFT_3494015 [Mycena olivaceomarginata]